MKAREFVKLAPGVYLTTSELAQHLGTSESYLKALRRRGEGPEFVRLSGRLVRYDSGRVMDWLKQKSEAEGNTQQ